MPLFWMPKKGTARNTANARATVVESDPVGGAYQGKIISKLAVMINKNSEPINPYNVQDYLVRLL